MSIDTATINYGIDKISSAIQAAMPTLTNVSEKMIAYSITDVIVSFGIDILLFSMICIFIRFLIKHEKELCAHDDNRTFFSEPSVFNIGIIIAVIFGVGFGISIMVDLRNLIMATTNPEMYTVMHLLKK